MSRQASSPFVAKASRIGCCWPSRGMAKPKLHVMCSAAAETPRPGACAQAGQLPEIEVAEDAQAGVLPVRSAEHALREANVVELDVGHELGQEWPEIAAGWVFDGTHPAQSQQPTDQVGRAPRHDVAMTNRGLELRREWEEPPGAKSAPEARPAAPISGP